MDRITWRLAGTGIRLYCHKGPLASWQTVPQAQDDRAFQDGQGENMKLKYVMTDISMNRTPRKKVSAMQNKNKNIFFYVNLTHMGIVLPSLK